MKFTGVFSQAAAGLHHHVAMLLEDHVVVVVVEKHGDGAELGGGAAGRRDLVGLQEVDLPEQTKIILIHRNPSNRLVGVQSEESFW